MIQVFELVNLFNISGTQKIIFKNNRCEDVAKIDENTKYWENVLLTEVTLSDNFHQRKLGHCKVKNFSIKKNSLIITIATSLNYY